MHHDFPTMHTICKHNMKLKILLSTRATPHVIKNWGTTHVNSLKPVLGLIRSSFRDSVPSVTFISTFVERTTGLSMNIEEIGQGTGSGIVWDDKVKTLEPHTPNPKPLSPQPSFLHPQPSTLNPQPSTPNKKHFLTNFHVIRTSLT